MLIFRFPSALTYVLGAQKNRLIEMVLLSTHNIPFGLEIIKLRILNSLIEKIKEQRSLVTVCVGDDNKKECCTTHGNCLKYRGSYMNAHVLLNLLNELGKRDKMQGLPSILSLFPNELNKFNNARA